ncbi:unnamed protein product [Lupinus luteus]|uniref:Potassium transporter n=1 Tax=Lupinus luteus TaxID=3873 RepID=A0AAV1VQH5_LUPLU
MDLESGAQTSKLSWVNLSRTLLLAYQSFGVVYGDLSTSPLYVYSSTFKGKSQNFHNEETIFGDGVLTPAISVLSSVSGLLVTDKNFTRGELALLACVLLVGTEAMYADLGHFTATSIRIAFAFVIYPCLVMQYMGQAAFLSKNLGSIGSSFYDSIPGLACTMVMFVNTFLMTLVIIFVWRKNVMLAMIFLLFFWAIEILYLSSVIMKVPQGGWVPLVLSCFFMVVMYVWYYGTKKKHDFDMDNKASLKWLLGLGPCLGVVRVPGIGFVYSELATGVPAIFSHFVTNFPAFHKVLVFVCIKSVPVPYVKSEERFLIERDCPKSYRMYRCTVRYGYNDTQRNSGEFENQLIQCIAKFILMEATEEEACSAKTSQSSSSFVVSEVQDFCADDSFPSIQSLELQSVDSVNKGESPQLRRRIVRFQLPNNNPSMDPEVTEELSDLMEAKEAGVAYILENSYVVAMKSSSLLKRLVIDYGYSFLRKNCRGAAETFNVPHICLIEVGMIYYV